MVDDEYVKCPYYHGEGRRSVHCEGVQEGCGLRLGFALLAGKNGYKATYCRKDWPACQVAGMLNKKYDYVP